MLVPYFGDYPTWIGHYLRNLRMIHPSFTWLLDTDERKFQRRVKARLGVTCPPLAGTGKIWDFRPALGVLYENELDGYDWWGHTDLDCVYGRVHEWMTDELLDSLDVISNAHAYVNGCWTLYRAETTRDLYASVPNWADQMANETPTGWAERSFTDRLRVLAERGDLRVRFEQWQVFEPHDLRRLHWNGDRLMCGNDETMMAHFKRTKAYPAGCVQ